MAAWTTACPDWRERIVARESLIPCPPPFPDRGDDALGVFCSLQMTDMPMRRDGTWPTMGEVCEPFVFDLVRALFGSQNPQTGASMVKESMLLISKKNGKSTIAAGIMLTALIMNFRPHAELLVLAPTIEIAKNSFEPASAMVRADAELMALMHINDNQRIIEHRVKKAKLKIVAADSGVVGGKKAGFVLFDEAWLFGKMNGAEAMVEEATGGQAARPEGWTLWLTTHSDEPPAGVFKKKLAYMRDVRDGVIDDPTTLPVLYEWPEDMLETEAFLDPANFYVTNPNLGKSQTVEFIKRKIAQAEAGEGEGEDTSRQIVLAKYLNVEIGMRLRRDRWSGANLWLDAAEPGLTLDALLARCEVAVMGIDSGGRDDLFGACVAGREKETGRWLAWSHGWALRSALEVRKRIASTLQGFVADGDLTLTDTGQQIVDQVAALARRVKDTGLMPEVGAIGVDAWGVGTLVEALVAAGFETYDDVTKRGGSILPVRQGVGLTGTIKTIEFKLGDGMLLHDGSNLMTWCVSNAKAELRGSNLYISKQSAGASKIDPLIALFNAVQMLEQGPVAAVSARAKSFWEVA
jgi:phage terminase large subunit-like protein